ncbi:MAG: HD-GYP domain-containing protein [Desulfovibrio sp.]|uniref:HD-GYP domain-containing protein n=1 Tax=Desulfovibrio sp. 7SRBS1 TaxID=3378064 RepID=UPI003B3EBF8F
MPIERMIKKIHIDALRVGMFVDRYGSGSFDSPLAMFQRIVRDNNEVRMLRRSGVDWIYIDTDKGVDVHESMGTYARKVAFSDEVSVAAKLYRHTLNHVHEVFARIKDGGDFNHHDSEDVVEGLVESVHRNDAAGICLTQLRGRDDYTYTHSVNVGLLSVVFGVSLGLEHAEVIRLGLAGIYHDIGKLRLPNEIIAKPGRLTPSEYRIAQTHALEGYRIMAEQADIHPDLLSAVAEHHERYDGSGYPRAIHGAGLNRFARLLSVVDVFDALTSDRPYAKAKTPSEAFRVMYSARGKSFEPQYVERFIKAMGIYPPGSFVRLNTGSYGVVCGSNSAQPLRPQVKVVYDRKLRQCQSEVLDLSDFNTAQNDKVEITEALDPGEYRIDIMRLLS